MAGLSCPRVATINHGATEQDNAFRIRCKHGHIFRFPSPVCGLTNTTSLLRDAITSRVLLDFPTDSLGESQLPPSNKPMIFLALDYGERRLGLAISDAGERLALPLQTLTRGVNDARGDVQNILSLMRARDAKALVLGIPGGSDASDEMAGRARRFAAKLLETARESGLELALFETDERFSSAQAHAELRVQGVSARISRDEGGAASIDARAAAVFLQTFLDSHRAPSGGSSGENFDQPLFLDAP